MCSRPGFGAGNTLMGRSAGAAAFFGLVVATLTLLTPGAALETIGGPLRGEKIASKLVH